jgi:hypothetical protein
MNLFIINFIFFYYIFFNKLFIFMDLSISEDNLEYFNTLSIY